MTVIGYGLVDEGLLTFVMRSYKVGPSCVVGVGELHSISTLPNRGTHDSRTLENEPLFK